MKYLKIFESYTSDKIVGYHKTNNADDILKNGFDPDKIKVAFLGKGFSFSLDPESLKDYPAKEILKCNIDLKNPVTDEKVWTDALKKVDPDNKEHVLLKISTKLSDLLKEMGYDGIMATRANGWWKNAPQRHDEIIVFDPKSITNVERL